MRPSAFALLLACSCQCDPRPVIECGPSEHAVGSGCVPDVFDQADLAPEPSAIVDADSQGNRYVRGTVLFVIESGVTADTARTLAASAGGLLTGSVPFIGLYRAHFSSVQSTAELDATVQGLMADGGVRYAMRDYVATASGVTTRPKESDTEACAPPASWQDPLDQSAQPTLAAVGSGGIWAYRKSGIFGAWDELYAANPSMAPVTVAVVDGPVQQQPVFRGLPFQFAVDVRATSGGSSNTELIHGTAVASVLGAPGDDTGMAGVLGGLSCPSYDLAPIAAARLPFQRSTLEATLSDYVLGVIWGVKSGARVVSLTHSWHLRARDPTPLLRLFRALFAAAPRVLFVTSAGNYGVDAADVIPGGAALPTSELPEPNVANVGAIDSSDQLASGPGWASDDAKTPGSITLAAPGTSVLATLPTGALTMGEGTSFSAPLVGGVAALLFALRPELTGADARKLLVDTADSISEPRVGSRRLNAQNAVSRLLGQLPSRQLGGGQCRDAPRSTCANVCPPGRTCVWCLRDSTLSLKMGAPTRVQTLNAVKGAFSVNWASDTEVSRATLRVSGNSGGAAHDSFVEYGWPAQGTPQVTKDDVSRSSLELILSGASSAGAFSDGTTGGQYDPFPRVTIATHSSLAASFRQDQVSGVLSESDASETADVTFTGHLISDEAANDPFACYR